MKAEILAAAEADLAEAVSYYNPQSEGLGYEFAAEVKQTLGRILPFPDAFRIPGDAGSGWAKGSRWRTVRLRVIGQGRPLREAHR